MIATLKKACETCIFWQETKPGAYMANCGLPGQSRRTQFDDQCGAHTFKTVATEARSEQQDACRPLLRTGDATIDLEVKIPSTEVFGIPVVLSESLKTPLDLHIGTSPLFAAADAIAASVAMRKYPTIFDNYDIWPSDREFLSLPRCSPKHFEASWNHATEHFGQSPLSGKIVYSATREEAQALMRAAAGFSRDSVVLQRGEDRIEGWISNAHVQENITSEGYTVSFDFSQFPSVVHPYTYHEQSIINLNPSATSLTYDILVKTIREIEAMAPKSAEWRFSQQATPYLDESMAEDEGDDEHDDLDESDEWCNIDEDEDEEEDEGDEPEEVWGNDYNFYDL